MKKHIVLNTLLIISLTIILSIFLSACGKKEGNTREDNDTAQKNKHKDRHISIINDTEQIINEVHITVGSGVEINHAYQKNPDETSFSIKISKDYKDYDEFTIILVDRYENKYKKTITSVPIVGISEVRFTAEDITEEPSFWKKIEMWANKD